MTVLTVRELQRQHVVGARSLVIHSQTCGHVKRGAGRSWIVIGDDPRYWRGQLRPGECCRPIVPRPGTPACEPGYLHA